MTQLSEYFIREEFACKCGCGFDTVDTQLITVLEDLRVKFAHPIVITSGCRCWLRNHQVGGSDQSQHIIGRAADIKIVGVSADQVADYLLNKYPNTLGIGRYDTFTHVDTRDGMARWDNRNA